ncbi:hypothetical protein FN976_19145 [Caenimonas sedimenti]|uniref:PA2779 family protein n=1 Tax=Caenimonas sedimenti TaxID=2596921 RepID=A0A562ZLW9_9BURK|nr:PA2779 family protein [Caenimonas sedimenti]TWO69407.1 hypothetical protein FN976_19145 [Caenimonas sedimenti]
MTSILKRAVCRTLVVSLMTLSFQSAQAGLIGAEQAAGAPATAERALVLGALERAEVGDQLRLAGVDPAAARERVNAMTDQEVRTLAQDIQAAPAGAASGWGILAVVLVAALIWYYAIRK